MDSAFQRWQNEIIDILEGCLHRDDVGINVDPQTETFKLCDGVVEPATRQIDCAAYFVEAI